MLIDYMFGVKMPYKPKCVTSKSISTLTGKNEVCGVRSDKEKAKMLRKYTILCGEYKEAYKLVLNTRLLEISHHIKTLADEIQKKNKLERIAMIAVMRGGFYLAAAIKRYFENRGFTLPTYGIATLIGYGLDRKGLREICQDAHRNKLVFLDGWTMKGCGKKTVDDALISTRDIDYEFAALIDPNGIADYIGTDVDCLCPWAISETQHVGLTHFFYDNEEGYSCIQVPEFNRKFAEDFFGRLIRIIDKGFVQSNEQEKIVTTFNKRFKINKIVKQSNIKGRRIIYGFNEVLKSMERGEGKRLLIAQDARPEDLLPVLMLAEIFGIDSEIDESPYNGFKVRLVRN